MDISEEWLREQIKKEDELIKQGWDGSITAINPELYKELQMQALLKKIWEKGQDDTADDVEDFCAYDCYGGNMDDAFNGGIDDGEVHFARELIGAFPELFEEFKNT